MPTLLLGELLLISSLWRAKLCIRSSFFRSVLFPYVRLYFFVFFWTMDGDVSSRDWLFFNFFNSFLMREIFLVFGGYDVVVSEGPPLTPLGEKKRLKHSIWCVRPPYYKPGFLLNILYTPHPCRMCVMCRKSIGDYHNDWTPILSRHIGCNSFIKGNERTLRSS